MTMILAGMLLARDIQIDRPERMPHGPLSFPQREQADTAEREEHPHDADDDPAGEEGLAEDVRAGVHGYGPEDEERDGQDHGHGLGNDGGFLQLGLLGGHLLLGLVALAGDHFKVHVCFIGKVVIVAFTDGAHGLPVVVV